MTHTVPAFQTGASDGYRPANSKGRGEMRKGNMTYTWIAALILGLAFYANALMQFVRNEIQWIENLCRVI